MSQGIIFKNILFKVKDKVSPTAILDWEFFLKEGKTGDDIYFSQVGCGSCTTIEGFENGRLFGKFDVKKNRRDYPEGETDFVSNITVHIKTGGERGENYPWAKGDNTVIMDNPRAAKDVLRVTGKVYNPPK